MNSPRKPTDEELFYENNLDIFANSLSMYDTNRRLEILIDEFLNPAMVCGKKILDVGCGFGFATDRLIKLGADVVATDISESLVEKIKNNYNCQAIVADAMNLSENFQTESFDIIFSSECIEHTPQPNQCILEMGKLLKSGGYISLSTPNILWSPVVRTATYLKLRKFEGLENFSTFRSLSNAFDQAHINTLKQKGLHLFPFQLNLHRLSTWMDSHAQSLKCLMINLCVLGRKQ